MIHAILGIKGKQSQQFTDDGRRIPVTFILAGPCWVTKIIEGGTYTNLQLAFGSVKHISKATEGNMKKAGLITKPRFLREIRIKDQNALNGISVGAELKLSDVFTPGDTIMVTGTSKGKGFASGIKRYGFKGGPRTHGQSDRERAPGSIGSGTTPGRVYRGKRMAGRMGTDTVSVKGLKVVQVDADTHTMTIKGVVPGGIGTLLFIQKQP